ncbi:MAG: hypothetical protein IIB17_12705, partial [Chloroflexi bacterium]|nr:hypothetical protein [Chloroflexota bacterium]
MMTKPRIAALAIALLAGLGLLSLVLFNRGVLAFPNSGEDEVDAKFAAAFLTRMDLRTFMDLDGVLEYGDSVQISPGGSGVLTYIAPEGSQLGRGSVVFRLFKSIGDTELLNAEQQIASANASVVQAQLALENLNAPASPAQVASANASVAQAELALENLNAPATPAQIASANASVSQAELALENLNAPATPAQIASANASVAQAQLALENLNAPATPAQIASADASVAQAQLALANLNATATRAQIASADASVAQAQFALENLNTTATPAQIASSNASVSQAEASLATAQGGVETAWASRRIARISFCDSESVVSQVWLYAEPICPVDGAPLSESVNITLLDMISDDYLVTEANNLLNAHQGFQSAVQSIAT